VRGQVFRGRERHLAVIGAVGGAAGQGQMVALVGDPGVGKSRLLVRLAHGHPELVRRLVLIDVPTDMGAGDSPAQRVDLLNTIAAFLADDDFEGLMSYYIGRVFSEPDVADLAASRLLVARDAARGGAQLL
jgi:pimeloyl-ACP methyl ester carboxylesterase